MDAGKPKSSDFMLSRASAYKVVRKGVCGDFILCGLSPPVSAGWSLVRGYTFGPAAGYTAASPIPLPQVEFVTLFEIAVVYPDFMLFEAAEDSGEGFGVRLEFVASSGSGIHTGLIPKKEEPRQVHRGSGRAWCNLLKNSRTSRIRRAIRCCVSTGVDLASAELTARRSLVSENLERGRGLRAASESHNQSWLIRVPRNA